MKKKILLSMMATAMALCVNTMPVSASNDTMIKNGSFEQTINEEDIQLYKAVRTKERASDGSYAIKIGAEKPDYTEGIPKWQFNLGKGSMHVAARNLEPNTKYTVKLQILNTTGVRCETGVIDLQGATDTPWNFNFDSKLNANKSEEWSEVTHSITTGPRSNEVYIYAYCLNKKDGKDSGAFFVDNIRIEQGDTVTRNDVNYEIGYKTPASDAFPNTIPAVQSFKKADKDNFKLDVNNQVFSTDTFSKEKTEYLAESMVDKGIINNYTIKTIAKAEDGEGIVIVKKPIQFTLSSLAKMTKEDAYQIDIDNRKAVIYSDYIEGIQNGTMTFLQATTQRHELPAGTVEDFTDQKNRGFQIDTARTFYSVDWLKEQMEQMAYYKQNKLQLRLKDSEGIRWASKIAPGLMDEEGYYYTQKDADELVAYANKFNIEIIPDVDYPGHSEMEVDLLEHAGKKDWVIGKRYDSNNIVPVLNITKKEVRDYMISMYKEAAEYFHAKTIHIGGDEYYDITSQEASSIIASWVNQELNTTNSTGGDGLVLFFNEAADQLIKEGLDVLVWNDNIALNGNVTLDKRVTIDVWAGAFKGRCVKASDALAAGYKVMSSSSTNYHNLWYQNKKDSVRTPLPKDMYENFTRYNYSVKSNTYNDDEKITANKDRALGQMFPIWSDILGGVSGQVLERTVFPRYATFSYITWGAKSDDNKEMDFAQFERLMFALGSPRKNIKTGAKINYNQEDLNSIINKIETALKDKNTSNEVIQENINKLSTKLDDIKANPANYQVNSFYTGIINEIIYDYENVEFDQTARADYRLLKEYVDIVDNLIPEEFNDYSSVETVINDIDYNLDSTKQSEVTTMEETLVQALKGLKSKNQSVNKEQVIATLIDAVAIDKTLYSSKSVDALNEAIHQAKVELANASTTQAKLDDVKAKLLEAIHNLGNRKADYYAVDAAIERARALKPEDYVDFSEVEKAVAAVVKDLDISKQSEVDAMAKAIVNAIANLEKKIIIIEEKESLKKVREQALAIDTSKYTKESVRVLKNAIKEAEEAIKNPNSTVSDFKEAEVLLQAAIDGLVSKPLDYRLMNAFVDLANILLPEDYGNFDAVNECLATIKPESDYQTQEEIDKVVDELYYALYDLYAIDEAAGKDFVIYALLDAIHDYDPTQYTQASYGVVEKLINDAKEQLASTTVTEDELFDLENAIYAAIDALIEVADYSVVEDAIANANALTKEHYIDFSEVEKAVNSVVKDLDITKQSEVDAMAKAIEDAISKLTLKQADYTKVNQAIEKANALKKEDYLDFSGVEKAIASVVKDLDITKQSEVDAMAKAIEDAINALEAKPDVKPTPEDKYEMIEGKDTIIKQGETPIFRSNASIETFKEVLLDGKVLDRKYYTVEEGSIIIKLTPEFTKTLTKGTYTLSIVSTDGKATTSFTVEESVTPDGPVINPEEPTEPTEPTTPGNLETPVNKPTESTTPKTGDNTPIVLWGSMVVLGGLGLMKLKRKDN